MKPELSFATTGSLPSDSANAKARRRVSSDVVTVRTTSTRGISGTGLKKCNPTKRSPRCVAAAIAATVRLDVFDAKMVAGPHRPSSSRQRVFLSSRSSVTASTTISHALEDRVAVCGRQLSLLHELGERSLDPGARLVPDLLGHIPHDRVVPRR